MDELDKILADEKETPATVLPEAESQKTEADLELEKKQVQLINLNKAIAEANEELRSKRTAKKADNPEAGTIPEIDFTDPSSQAWDKHINGVVNPLHNEIEQEKEEIRTFAIREFLADKPALSANPDKIKELVGVYDKIKTTSGRTKEGVLSDLNRAFGAIYSEELISQARDSKRHEIMGNILFSDPAVSRGSTGYKEDYSASPETTLSEDDKAILAKWNYSPQEWGEAKKKYQ